MSPRIHKRLGLLMGTVALGGLILFVGSNRTANRFDPMVFGAIESDDPGGLAVALSKGSSPNSRRELLELDHRASLPARLFPFLHSYSHETALMAAAGRDVRLVDILIRNGACVDARNEDGLTALMFAARRGDAPTIRELLRARASVTTVARNGSTALMQAARRGSLESVRVLLTAGAYIDSVDRDGRTPLSYSIIAGHPDIAAFFLKHGASVQRKDRFGRTPLMDACILGNSRIVDLCIERGANPTVVDCDGKTAADYARSALPPSLQVRLTAGSLRK